LIFQLQNVGLYYQSTNQLASQPTNEAINQ